jgi:hypothetical protein
MGTMLEEYTTEYQSSVVRFFWVKGLYAKDINKKIFPVYGGKCFSCNAVHNWVKKFSPDFGKSQMMPAQARKWLRQQSKDFYTAGFDAIVKRWDKYINVIEGYAEK